MSADAVPGHGESVPQAGDLRTRTVPELLWSFHKARATGLFRVRSSEVEKSLWMTYGQPVFARSNLPGDRLTERLRQRGLLTREEFEAAQVAIEQSGGAQRIGQVLLEARLIPKRVLDESLHEQLLWILDSMFTWRDGQWTFESGVNCDESVTLNMPMAAIIMEGARNRLPLEWLWRAVDGPDSAPRIAVRGDRERALAVLADKLRLYPTERICLQRLDGGQSLRALLDDFDTDERELMSLVYTMGLIGKLELVELVTEASGDETSQRRQTADADAAT